MKRHLQNGAQQPARKRVFGRVAVVLAFVAVCGAALLWALPSLPTRPQSVAPNYYSGVVEMWNVEAFEGGSGSRENWLIGRAAKFEAAHKGLFVHVTSLTYEQAVAKLAEGRRFDIICFTRGMGSKLNGLLAPLDVDCGQVCANFAASGQVGNAQYAVPLYSGAYCLFARSEQLAQDRLLSDALTATYTRKIGKNSLDLQPLLCGFTPFNSPLTALAMSGGKGKAGADESITQYMAYERFVANKTAVTLLGTQRDMYRLAQRESNGKIDALSFAPLGGYTDLVQYLGVAADCGDKAASCNEFVQYMISAETQQTLVELSLFTVLDRRFYTDGRFADCERALCTAYVPNVFIDDSAIARQRQTAIVTLGM